MSASTPVLLLQATMLSFYVGVMDGLQLLTLEQQVFYQLSHLLSPSTFFETCSYYEALECLNLCSLGWPQIYSNHYAPAS